MKQIDKTFLSKYCNGNSISLDATILKTHILAKRNSMANEKGLGNCTKDESIDLWKGENFQRNQEDILFVGKITLY